MRSAAVASLALFVIGLASGVPHLAKAQSQASIIADNDGILIDGTTFTVIPGKAKANASAMIKRLGARKLGPGAIVFRSDQQLYIVDVPVRLSDGTSANAGSVFVNADKGRTNRVRAEYLPPQNPEQQTVHDMLKARGSLEMIAKLFSPFRLPVELTIRMLGCDGVVNAWYQLEESRPTVSVCYEYVNNIFKHAPEETTPEGLTRQNAIIGQLLFVIAHEMGHAVFEMFTIPVFGREEDAADQVATFFLLHLGMERARWLIEGAAHAYRGYVKDYKQNPDVRVKLEAFSSNHGSPEERFYNLLCIAYGANPTLFGYVVENGYLPKTRAGSCAYEYKTLTNAVYREISPHLDRPMARGIWDMTCFPDLASSMLSQ